MNFYSIRDLRTDTKEICDTVHETGEAVVTRNGKPAFLMLDISDGNYESMLRAVRQAKAMIAFNEMRTIAAENGFLSEEEIEAEIAKARSERQTRKASLQTSDTAMQESRAL